MSQSYLLVFCIFHFVNFRRKARRLSRRWMSISICFSYFTENCFFVSVERGTLLPDDLAFLFFSSEQYLYFLEESKFENIRPWKLKHSCTGTQPKTPFLITEWRFFVGTFRFSISKLFGIQYGYYNFFFPVKWILYICKVTVWCTVFDLL